MEEIEQHWLYALSAPMAALNGASLTSPRYYEAEGDLDLNKWWGINNRRELLEMLRMADTGHAERLNDAYWQYPRRQPSQWQALLEELAPRDRANYEFAARTYADCGFGGTRAWDLGRMGYLLRAGVYENLITESESLWLHSRLALRARHFYNSWDTYIAGYMFGKSLWNCSSHDDDVFPYRVDRQGAEHWNRCIIMNMLKRGKALFASLPWDLPLEYPDRPDSLEEDTWS